MPKPKTKFFSRAEIETIKTVKSRCEDLENAGSSHNSNPNYNITNRSLIQARFRTLFQRIQEKKYTKVFKPQFSMVKGKISKHSRAARRGEVALEPEVKSLAQLPRAEKTDLTSVLIRTAAKNGDLLDAKMKREQERKKKIRAGLSKKSLEKKIVSATNNMDKERLERALNITNRLDGKISKAVARAKFVQNARKAGWDLTNASIKREMDVTMGSKISSKISKDAGDISTAEAAEDEEEVESGNISELNESSNTGFGTSTNMFNMLPTDVEE